ncbi:cellulose binding domain-containing protein [Streptomyces sp. 2A115]|uniref:cellulose binding domain-containing protein n=1 Tax=Streptomyces sp. 2A115 TaxID=3457439 RepID=UPI003FD193B4
MPSGTRSPRRRTWSWPSGQRVTQVWSATVTQSGSAVTAADAGCNAAIAPGGTVTFGFNGSSSGSNTAPTAFTLSGTACTAWSARVCRRDLPVGTHSSSPSTTLRFPVVES